MNSAGQIIRRAVHASYMRAFPRDSGLYPGIEINGYIAREQSLYWPLQHMYWKIWSTP